MKRKTLFCLLISIVAFSTLAENTFRYDLEKMQTIANEKVFPNRIFYQKKSQGPYSQWFDAVKVGDIDKIKEFLAQPSVEGQSIDVKDEYELGQTALGWAAFIGYKDIVELLVANGASLKATDRADVKHVFKSAIMGGNIDVIKYIYSLSEDFIDINELEDDGETMLIVASYAGRVESIKFLLEKGALVDIVSDVKGHNALTFACTMGHQEAVKILLEHGAINYKTGEPSC